MTFTQKLGDKTWVLTGLYFMDRGRKGEKNWVDVNYGFSLSKFPGTHVMHWHTRSLLTNRLWNETEAAEKEEEEEEDWSVIIGDPKNSSVFFFIPKRSEPFGNCFIGLISGLREPCAGWQAPLRAHSVNSGCRTNSFFSRSLVSLSFTSKSVASKLNVLVSLALQSWENIE